MSEPEFHQAASPQRGFTVETAKVLAEVAHNRQKDKLKRPYREHVIAVGDALADFDDDIRIAGYLHDIAEDTPITRQALLEMGVSERAVDIIERVTNRLHDNPDDYADGIRYIAEDHDAALVKIADNAHNSLPERVRALAEKWPDKPPVTKYRDARPVLYAAVEVEEIRKILGRVNPWLLKELDDRLDEEDETDYENLSYEDGSVNESAPVNEPAPVNESAPVYEPAAVNEPAPVNESPPVNEPAAEFDPAVTDPAENRGAADAANAGEK